VPRLVPYREVQGAERALLEAHSLGRYYAPSKVAAELAKTAGALLARREQELYDLEKLARDMVATGAMSAEDFLLEKEAAFAGLSGLFGKARAAASGLRGKIGGLFSRGKFSPMKATKGWSAGPKALPTSLGGVEKAVGGAPGAAGAAAKKVVAPAAAKKGFGWGAALPWMAAGGLAYGAYKGVPWAARQLEQTSTTPMAHGLGWSPVSYGYGYSPYGSGMPNMGSGA